jgi:hypothetical protein
MPTQPSIQWAEGAVYLGGKGGLTVDINIEPSLRMSGAIPPTPLNNTVTCVFYCISEHKVKVTVRN